MSVKENAECCSESGKGLRLSDFVCNECGHAHSLRITGECTNRLDVRVISPCMREGCSCSFDGYSIISGKATPLGNLAQQLTANIVSNVEAIASLPE